MTKPIDIALNAIDFDRFFHAAGVKVDALDASKSQRGKAIIIGAFFGSQVDRPVPFSIKDRNGVATLRIINERGNKKRYYFEIQWEEVPEIEVTPTSKNKATTPVTMKSTTTITSSPTTAAAAGAVVVLRKTPAAKMRPEKLAHTAARPNNNKIPIQSKKSGDGDGDGNAETW